MYVTVNRKHSNFAEQKAIQPEEPDGQRVNPLRAKRKFARVCREHKAIVPDDDPKHSEDYLYCDKGGMIKGTGWRQGHMINCWDVVEVS